MIVQKSVDMVPRDGVTVTARAPGAGHPECGSISTISPEFKPATNRGGARPGAGRPRKAGSVAAAPEGLRWYVAQLDRRTVRTRGGEPWADAIERVVAEAGYDGVVPQFWHERRHPSTGQVIWQGLSLAFPGYMLVQFDRAGLGWRILPHLPGLRRLIGLDAERPLPVPASQAAWVIAQFGPDGVQRRVVEVVERAPLPVGASVRVVGGLGLGWSGRVLESDGRSVLVDVGGRRVRMAQAAVACAPCVTS